MKTEDVYSYCEQHSGVEPKFLAQIHRETHLKMLKPRMLSGHLQGRLLSMLSHLIKPKTILEIGTFTGYSAICLTEGLLPGGKVYTIEANEEYEALIKKNIRLSKTEAKIELILGDAIQVIPNLPHVFDMVFIDADKNNYPHYYDLVFPKLKVGGIIISDNVLWDTKVTDPNKKDKTTQILRDYNKKLSEDTRTEKVILPLRDGLTISRKIKD
jgi:predicted O-methyltransferase YrrM